MKKRLQQIIKEEVQQVFNENSREIEETAFVLRNKETGEYYFPGPIGASMPSSILKARKFEQLEHAKVSLDRLDLEDADKFEIRKIVMRLV